MEENLPLCSGGAVLVRQRRKTFSWTATDYDSLAESAHREGMVKNETAATRIANAANKAPLGCVAEVHVPVLRGNTVENHDAPSDPLAHYGDDQAYANGMSKPPAGPLLPQSSLLTVAPYEQARDRWCERSSAALFEACFNRDLEKATRILQQAVDRGVASEMTSFRDDFRESALHMAAAHGQTDAVRLLLAQGADVNAVNNLGSTPLNRAAVAGRVKIIEILLDAGADLEHQDDISGTPLHGAARRNHCACCRLLLNRGAAVDVCDGVGNTPLHLAAAEGAISSVQVLVMHYADPQLRNVREQTPLDVARVSWIGTHCKTKIAKLLRAGSN